MLDGKRLRQNCLNFWELLALNIALISPTMTAALIVPLMYGTAGNAGWLSYAFGAVMLMFVALSLNQFTKRSAGTGSMYAYAVRGLGPTTGALAGWCLIWAYTFIGTAGMTGFTTFAQQLLGMVNVNVPAILCFAVCGALAWFLAYRDIQLSTILMLGLEAISVTLILILIGIALTAHGFAPDTDQIALKGFSFSNLGLGVVVAIFSLVGFECATQFGHEAKNPTKTIPRAVIWSLVVTGLFFVLVTYTETMALKNNKPTLDQLTAPLTTLSMALKVGWLAPLIDAGAMVSFFSLAASCMNAGARLIYAMGQQGIFHERTGVPHKSFGTPHIALTVMLALEFLIPTGMILGKVQVTDAFNDAGTFGAFGFLGGYFFICIAAPMYLKKIGELKAPDIALAAAAVLLLLVPAVGSVYPVPSPPLNMFPYIFLSYFALGFVWFMALKLRQERELSRPSVAIEELLKSA
ncbi:MAG TPA: APC family permease [Candidatus Acidoferrales bacterium]|nr:APC family permease [Candidatus Acidoferrales bacterium]